MAKNNNYFQQQAKLLLNVAGHIDWNSCFAMKGGTAINFFYEDMPRLSVDIDLVYLPIKPRNEALLEIHTEIKKMQRKLKDVGFQAKLLNAQENSPAIKIEVANEGAVIIIEPNTTLRGNLLPTEKRELCKSAQSVFETAPTVICLSYPELFAGKLNAMLDRQHPRDIFDMQIFLKNNKSLKSIMDTFVVYLAQGNRPFSEILKPNLLDIAELYNNTFAGMTEQEIKLDELLETRKKVIEEVPVALKDNHKGFLLSLMNNAPDWSLLSFDNLKNLAGIQWKLQNIAKMSGSKKKEEIDKLESIFKG
jgi:predicted nucleotidyltransferase component of viral defense system